MDADALIISIHALREEGDSPATMRTAPRWISIHALREEGDHCFQYSAPLAATFLSTPSARRATQPLANWILRALISIHALREEGDAKTSRLRRALTISIHALREEGDIRSLSRLSQLMAISIHALREEGDPLVVGMAGRTHGYFYPRPPRGGRRLVYGRQRRGKLISIHALREEGDIGGNFPRKSPQKISIHALREEGDAKQKQLDALQRISIHALREEGDGLISPLYHVVE